MTNDTPPGPRGVPVIGNTFQWASDPCGFRERCAEQYGPVVNYDILGMDAYMLTDPDAIKRVLVDEPDRFPKQSSRNGHLTKLVGDGLLTSDGDLWQQQRAAIEPAFYMSHIKNYSDIMVNRTTERLAGWDSGSTLDINREMRRLTLDILVEAMFGQEIDSEARGLHEATADIRAPLDPRKQPITFIAPDWAPIPFLRREQNAIEHIEEQIYEIITSRRRSNEDRDDLVSMLLDADTDMDDEQIRDEMVTFLFAGHETTAAALTYIWHLLSRAPEVETRLHDELDTVLDSGSPSIEDIPALDYTEAVVKEALRLYPPAHEMRRTPTEDVTINGYTIPEGEMVVLPTWVLHHDGRFWDTPEAFRPERWEKDADRPEFAYFPFGGGHRRCIGQQFAMTEAQLLVAMIAKKFTFERQYDDLSLSASVTLSPKGPVEMVPQSR
jgi:cytochrome P450